MGHSPTQLQTSHQSDQTSDATDHASALGSWMGLGRQAGHVRVGDVRDWRRRPPESCQLSAAVKRLYNMSLGLPGLYIVKMKNAHKVGTAARSMYDCPATPLSKLYLHRWPPRPGGFCGRNRIVSPTHKNLSGVTASSTQMDPHVMSGSPSRDSFHKPVQGEKHKIIEHVQPVYTRCSKVAL